MNLFQRAISSTLKKCVTSFPVTVLTGPRQSGKTTLLKTLFPDYYYISLEDPDSLARVKADTRGFLNSQEKCIIDEAQQDPELFSYLQSHVDRINKPGMIILSGSQNFLLAEKISQSLAGRAAILELLPLSYDEYLTHPEAKPTSVWNFIYHGGFPRPYQQHLDSHIWYSSYIRTYLERDVRSLINVRDLTQFQLFLKHCAGFHGQLLNLSAIAQACGISQTTATEWLSILEASYITYRLRPHYRNFKKRLVKSPKLYFYDSAIVSMLLGIESPEHLQLHASRGAIFEGFVLSEIIKTYLAKGEQAPIYFWRDHIGTEIDALLDHSEHLIGIEIKSGTTITPSYFSALKRWQKISKEINSRLYLIYTGNEKYQHENIQILPWSDVKECSNNQT